MTAPTLIGPVLDDIVDNLTIVELEQHLDDDVPCIVGHAPAMPCASVAEWVVTCGACGMNWTACMPHRNRVDQSFYDGMRCSMTDDDPGPGCGAIMWRPWAWRPL